MELSLLHLCLGEQQAGTETENLQLDRQHDCGRTWPSAGSGSDCGPSAFDAPIT